MRKTVIECPHCGFENSEEEILCRQCSLPLRLEEAGSGLTRRLDHQVVDLNNRPRWGTASLGSERKLLLHIRGYDKPLVVSLSEKLVLGRLDTTTGEIPDIDLDGYGAQDLGVSRRHAAILCEPDALKVVDLASANATYINGQKLIAHQPRILRDGDELRLAQMIIRIHFA